MREPVACDHIIGYASMAWSLGTITVPVTRKSSNELLKKMEPDARFEFCPRCGEKLDP